MINLGSISEQTLAGMLTTATHGTGVDHRVLSSHVQAVRLLQADGTKVTCSRDHHPDLFFATLCSLGSTGIILDVRMEVSPAFRLREVQETHGFNDVIHNFDAIARSAEFVRLWWWPQADEVRVSAMDKTREVSHNRAFPFRYDLLMQQIAQAPTSKLALALFDRVSRNSSSAVRRNLHSSSQHLDRAFLVVARQR